jgi:hypothetical protein
LVKIHGIPKIVEQQRDFPFIAISPQCPIDKWWVDPWLIEALNALLDEAMIKKPTSSDFFIQIISLNE